MGMGISYRYYPFASMVIGSIYIAEGESTYGINVSGTKVGTNSSNLSGCYILLVGMSIQDGLLG